MGARYRGKWNPKMLADYFLDIENGYSSSQAQSTGQVHKKVKIRPRETQLLLNIDKIDKFRRTLKIPPEKKIMELNGKLIENTYDVYTDESRINNETGFAVCIFKINEPYKDLLYRLNPTNSVFQAKLEAIGFAAGWVIEHD
ncbi:hypothetical protein AVEN_111995-1 [Araneus ventricosus]|uniref:RNase H type-1 domain-containing protein n=1 Tax=Araneus ventricosus TaxID=182803 RepID=A0A4Y2I068_ARAVE|nr:hypothetical protein AVEN_111995-1 [Araneus ventricosus]